ncbi:hypothetical protein KCP69_01545 [Salmonella enterica subsp. enterica]|nr:hypothetical protein KCP69_01545 [Salmonella enterica subsp. enterica]
MKTGRYWLYNATAGAGLLRSTLHGADLIDSGDTTFLTSGIFRDAIPAVPAI